MHQQLKVITAITRDFVTDIHDCMCIICIGLGFWKCARRRVYAVLPEETNTADSSNDDDDYEPAGPSRKRKEER